MEDNSMETVIRLIVSELGGPNVATNRMVKKVYMEKKTLAKLSSADKKSIKSCLGKMVDELCSSLLCGKPPEKVMSDVEKSLPKFAPVKCESSLAKTIENASTSKPLVKCEREELQTSDGDDLSDTTEKRKELGRLNNDRKKFRSHNGKRVYCPEAVLKAVMDTDSESDRPSETGIEMDNENDDLLTYTKQSTDSEFIGGFDQNAKENGQEKNTSPSISINKCEKPLHSRKRKRTSEDKNIFCIFDESEGHETGKIVLSPIDCNKIPKAKKSRVLSEVQSYNYGRESSPPSSKYRKTLQQGSSDEIKKRRNLPLAAVRQAILESDGDCYQSESSVTSSPGKLFIDTVSENVSNAESPLFFRRKVKTNVVISDSESETGCRQSLFGVNRRKENITDSEENGELPLSQSKESNRSFRHEDKRKYCSSDGDDDTLQSDSNDDLDLTLVKSDQDTPNGAVAKDSDIHVQRSGLVDSNLKPIVRLVDLKFQTLKAWTKDGRMSHPERQKRKRKKSSSPIAEKSATTSKGVSSKSIDSFGSDSNCSQCGNSMWHRHGECHGSLPKYRQDSDSDCSLGDDDSGSQWSKLDDTDKGALSVNGSDDDSDVPLSVMKKSSKKDSDTDLSTDASNTGKESQRHNPQENDSDFSLRLRLSGDDDSDSPNTKPGDMDRCVPSRRAMIGSDDDSDTPLSFIGRKSSKSYSSSIAHENKIKMKSQPRNRTLQCDSDSSSNSGLSDNGSDSPDTKAGVPDRCVSSRTGVNGSDEDSDSPLSCIAKKSSKKIPGSSVNKMKRKTGLHRQAQQQDSDFTLGSTLSDDDSDLPDTKTGVPNRCVSSRTGVNGSDEDSDSPLSCIAKKSSKTASGLSINKLKRKYGLHRRAQQQDSDFTVGSTLSDADSDLPDTKTGVADRCVSSRTGVNGSDEDSDSPLSCIAKKSSKTISGSSINKMKRKTGLHRQAQQQDSDLTLGSTLSDDVSDLPDTKTCVTDRCVSSRTGVNGSDEDSDSPLSCIAKKSSKTISGSSIDKMKRKTGLHRRGQQQDSDLTLGSTLSDDAFDLPDTKTGVTDRCVSSRTGVSGSDEDSDSPLSCIAKKSSKTASGSRVDKMKRKTGLHRRAQQQDSDFTLGSTLSDDASDLHDTKTSVTDRCVSSRTGVNGSDEDSDSPLSCIAKKSSKTISGQSVNKMKKKNRLHRQAQQHDSDFTDDSDSPDTKAGVPDRCVQSRTGVNGSDDSDALFSFIVEKCPDDGNDKRGRVKGKKVQMCIKSLSMENTKDEKELGDLRKICRVIGLVLRNSIELKGCDNASAKVNRIKDLLKNRGMKGKPTMKKAEQFLLEKELRELETPVSEEDDHRSSRSRSRLFKMKRESPERTENLRNEQTNIFSRMNDIFTCDYSSD